MGLESKVDELREELDDAELELKDFNIAASPDVEEYILEEAKKHLVSAKQILMSSDIEVPDSLRTKYRKLTLFYKECKKLF